MNDLREFNFDVGLLVPFYHVAQAGSIAQGAERMRVERTAVSRQITTLEDQLGFRLFEPGQRIRRTEAGARLLRVVELLMIHATKLQAVLEKKGRGGNAGKF